MQNQWPGETRLPCRLNPLRRLPLSSAKRLSTGIPRARLICDSANMDHIGSSKTGRAGQHTLKMNRTSPQGVMNRRPPPYLGGIYGHFYFRLLCRCLYRLALDKARGPVRLCIKAERSGKFSWVPHGGNAREHLCWPCEPHGRRLAGPSTAFSGGSPPRDVEYVFCLRGNPRGGDVGFPRDTWTCHV